MPQQLTHDGTYPVRPSGQATVNLETRDTIDVLEVETFEKGELLRVEDGGRGGRLHLLNDDMGVSDYPPGYNQLEAGRRGEGATDPDPSTCCGAP